MKWMQCQSQGAKTACIIKTTTAQEMTMDAMMILFVAMLISEER